jgi:transcriptional regulator with PAS, ATPase and Fis domain
MDILEKIICNGLETIRLRKEVKALQEKYLAENMPCFIGESNAISDVVDFVATVAKSQDTPILVLGGTGTGKELIAQAIHSRSPNFKGPFVTLNCGAIPENLVESELFGYERGAFSGASEKGKKGLVEEAAEGTLFLDEVGDMCLTAQAKLLRFMENGEIYKLGGTRKIKVQTRIVSATNRDLKSMIEEGTFRRDLYYRLAVIKVEIPSLNKRRDDIMPIAKHFLVEFSNKHGRKLNGFSSDAVLEMNNFNWDGNVRQLRNMVERGVIVCKGKEITPGDLGIEKNDQVAPETIDSENYFPPLTSQGVDLPQIQEKMERFYLEEALDMTGGNESKAALLLNINHHTFRYRWKKLQGKGE